MGKYLYAPEGIFNFFHTYIGGQRSRPQPSAFEINIILYKEDFYEKAQTKADYKIFFSISCYDDATGLVYVHKSNFFEEDGTYVINNVRMQFLQLIN